MYSQIFELHAELLKALAHPRRLEIIQLLRDQQLSVTDIYEMLDLPQANISQHLMILRDSGVVTTQREGKQIIYSLTHPKIVQACDALREVLIDQHRGTELEDTLLLRMKDLVPIVHDPVCKMRVSPRTASDSVEYQGQHYYFCASGCSKKFRSDPEKFKIK
jgi:ArsR family transcriptional regulator